MLAAEDFVARCTTFAITARVFFGLEVGCIARWCAVMSDSVPVAATRGRSTLSIGVSRFEISVLSSLVVIRRGGKGNSGKGSSDDNEDLHSVKKNNKNEHQSKGRQRRNRPTRKLGWKRALNFSRKQSMCWGGFKERELVQRWVSSSSPKWLTGLD